MLRKPSLVEAMLRLAEDIFDTLGPDHSESVYQKAFEIALAKGGYVFDAQRHLNITFMGQSCGFCIPDLIVCDSLIIELKVLNCINHTAIGQVKKYMRLMGEEEYDGLVINFGERVSQHILSAVDEL